MKNNNSVFILTLLLTFISCGKTGTSGTDSISQYGESSEDVHIISSEDYIEPIVYKAGRQEWKTKWSNHISKSIDLYGENLLNIKIVEEDLAAVGCLGFNNATPTQKKQFWTIILASMAKYESGYKNIRMKPRNNRDRIRRLQNKLPMGLLQLGTGTTGHGKGCSNADQGDWLLNPENNLQCGVQVMNNQLSGGKRENRTDIIGRIFPNPRHYYWSVLTYGDDCIETGSICRSGKKDKVIKRIRDQLSSVENYEIFNFCF